jgi:hypothetical protein
MSAPAPSAASTPASPLKPSVPSRTYIDCKSYRHKLINTRGHWFLDMAGYGTELNFPLSQLVCQFHKTDEGEYLVHSALSNALKIGEDLGVCGFCKGNTLSPGLLEMGRSVTGIVNSPVVRLLSARATRTTNGFQALSSMLECQW